MKFRTKLKMTLTAAYEFDVDSAKEAEDCARFGIAKGYIEWDECDDDKIEVIVEEVNDEENPS